MPGVSGLLAGRRERLEVRLLRLLCRATGVLPRAGADALPRVRVLLGPLRGTLLTMPAAERLAYAIGTYERHVVRAVREHVRPGAVAFDIGANAGYIALVMAKGAGPGGRVFAFDPDPRSCRALEANAGRLRTGNLSVVPAAVGSAPGHVRLATFAYTLVSQMETATTAADAVFVEVDRTTIDSFVYDEGHPPPAVIKIDVEGAEEHVIQGAVTVLKRARPAVVAEVRAAAWPAIEAIVEPLGYERRVLSGTGHWTAGYGMHDILLTSPDHRG
jgi:FkbM family methyltransferase